MVVLSWLERTLKQLVFRDGERRMGGEDSKKGSAEYERKKKVKVVPTHSTLLGTSTKTPYAFLALFFLFLAVFGSGEAPPPKIFFTFCFGNATALFLVR